MKDYELWWEVLREYLHKERRKTLKNVVLNRGTGLNDIDTLMTILSNAEYQQHQNRKSKDGSHDYTGLTSEQIQILQKFDEIIKLVGEVKDEY